VSTEGELDVQENEEDEEDENGELGEDEEEDEVEEDAVDNDEGEEEVEEEVCIFTHAVSSASYSISLELLNREKLISWR